VRNINYKALVPKDSFIGRYLSFMERQETAVAYDFWCACWLLSLALGRGVVVPRPRAPIYMNLYAILVAESGTTRKSSAVRAATDIARLFIDNLKQENDEHVELIETKITPEAFEHRLISLSNDFGYSQAAISVSELVTFFGKEKYTMAMPGMLTDLYDSPTRRYGGGTLVRKRTEIHNVYINVLSASTPSWLCRAVNPDVIEGGFTSRCLFIVSEQRKAHIAWPEETQDEQEFKESCVAFLTQTRKRSHHIREISLRDDALTKFKHWYTRREDSSDSFRSSFESREDSHVLRLAGLLSVNADRWEILPDDIDTATSIIKKVKEDGATLFVGAGSEPLLLGVAKLQERLTEAGVDGIDHATLYKQMRYWMKRDEFVTALDIMHEMAMIQKFIVPREMGKGGKDTVMWRATNSIAAPGSLQQVVSTLSSSG